jgi:hypothetical protein
LVFDGGITEGCNEEFHRGRDGYGEFFAMQVE